jgi:RNA polymerase-associated protein CTR9
MDHVPSFSGKSQCELENIEEHKRGFQRCAEFYTKALQLDPMCAFGSQGIAIVTAEDAL